jgi:hypothetical protein
MEPGDPGKSPVSGANLDTSTYRDGQEDPHWDLEEFRYINLSAAEIASFMELRRLLGAGPASPAKAESWRDRKPLL